MTTVVAFAYQAFGHIGLQTLERLGVRIALVLSHADRPGETIWWPSVARWCDERGIPCLIDADLTDDAVFARVREAQPDLVVSFYFRHLIPMRYVELAALGGWNLHGSPLPRYRGRSPVNWMLLNGERDGGITLHRMLKKPDAGDILAQRLVRVHPDQDALGLTRQLVAHTPALIEDGIGALIAGSAQPRGQDATQASYFGGRTPADGAIDWAWPARRVHDLVRAVAPPWPGAFATVDGRRVQIQRTAVATDLGTSAAPGTLIDERTVACGAGTLALLDLVWTDGGGAVALIAGQRLGPGLANGLGS